MSMKSILRWEWPRRAVTVLTALAASLSVLGLLSLAMVGLLDAGAVLSGIMTAAFCLLIGHYIIIRPMHERYGRMLQASQEMRAQMEEAGRIGKIGWWQYNHHADHLMLSEEIVRLLGVDAATAPETGAQFFDMIHAADLAHVKDTLGHALRTKSAHQVDYRINCGHGVRWFQQRSSTEFSPHGIAMKSFGTIQDITEVRNAEAQRAEFVARVSHELRTPLTSINGSLAMMREGALGGLPDRAAAVCEIAHKNCQLLAKLINDILDSEKLGAGEMSFTFETYDLAALVGEAVTSNESYATALDVTLAFTVTGTPIYARLDRDRFAQVMNNLLSNAAKFSEAGGTVRVRVFVHGNTAQVEVADSGIGIPLCHQSRIFDRFSQCHEPTARTNTGTGLGLNIARAIVVAHDGDLKLESVEGKGTTFRISLPLETSKRCMIAA